MSPLHGSPPKRGEERAGIIRMTDFRRYFGKIFLDDDRESSVIRFPETYEDGDRIFASFPDDNSEEPPVSFRVANEGWNYGTVITLKPEGDGSILINWPVLRGLIYFKRRDLQARIRMAVRFRLKKDQWGNLSVSDPCEAPGDMAHYAAAPLCGRLVRGVPLWKSGLVKKIVNKDPGWFGFIERPGITGDVFFAGHLFEQAYGRKAMIGDVVYFQSAQFDRGPAVKVFNPSGDDENNSAWVMETRTYQGQSLFIRCPETTFSNFLEPSPDKLYFAYAGRSNVATETREVRIERIPEAIALIKGKGVPEELKLAAVDFLIGADVEHPASFKAPIMRAQKGEILERTAAGSFQKGDLEKALKTEILLQTIDFRPKRLADYHQMKPPMLLLEAPAFSPPREDERPWRMLQADILPSPEEDKRNAWRPIFEAPSGESPNIAPAAWILDLDRAPGATIMPADDELFFDIQINEGGRA